LDRVDGARKFNFKFDRIMDKAIIKLAWPSITEQLLEMMVGIVSTIFMGRLGTNALAAVGMVNMLMGFLQTVFTGLSMGTTVIIARVTGEGDIKEAKRALIQSIYMAAFFGVTMALIGKLFSTQILQFFYGGAKEEIFILGISYFKIILVSVPFFVVDIIVSGAMRGSGDTKTPMVITSGVNIINIILNIVLIFGVQALHIPALGVVGSAIAVTISRVLGVTARIMVLFLRKKCKLHLTFKDDYRLKAKLLKRIINIGVPGFIEQAVMQGGFLILQIIIVSMGVIAMASYQIGINLNALAFFPIFGLALANTTLVGQSLGERKYKKAESYAYESLKITMALGLIIGTLMVIFAKPLVMLYTTDPKVIKEATGFIRTFGILEPMLAILNVCSATLKASGDIMYVMVTSFVGLWSCRVLLSYSLDRWLHIGVFAIMIGIFFDFSIRSIMYLYRMNKGDWKYLKV